MGNVTSLTGRARGKAPLFRPLARAHRGAGGGPGAQRDSPHQAAVRALRPIQASLRVGAAHDPEERAADATADRVMSMPEPAAHAAEGPAVAAGREPAGEPLDAARLRRAGIDDQPSLDVLATDPPVPTAHQPPDVPEAEDVDTEKLEGDELAELESGEVAPIEEAAAPGDGASSDEGATAQAGAGSSEEAEAARARPVRGATAARDGDGCDAAMGPEGGQAPDWVARRVAHPGSGRPLPQSERDFLAPRFGVPFRDVRIHDQPTDRAAAARIGARAFTLGRDVWLGPGERVDDRRLMAHELTHVLQQTGRAPRAGRGQHLAPAPARREPVVRRGWLASKVEKYARHVPGYTLVSVILGKSPITGKKMPRTAENLIGGFLGLLPGGTLLFDRLKETQALTEAFDWVRGRLSSLDITWARVKRVIGEVWDAMPTTSPIETIERIVKPLIDDIVTFVKEIALKVLEFILKGALKLAGSHGLRVWAVIQKAGQVIGLILKDPLGFAKNLVKAVVGGFQQFSAHVVDHLKRGLLGWLFGTLQELQLEMPARLDFKGLISIVLQLLGLTYANFRRILVKELGRDGERKVAFLEKSVEMVQILLKQGFLGIWQKMLALIDGFKATVIEGIKSFVTVTLVKAGVKWLAGLSNPVGAIVKVALAIYDLIVAFLERLDQIRKVAESIFDSIGAIARGKTQAAADFIERTIAGTIPVVISFVAALIPVDGIARKIKEILQRLRKPVEKAMTRLVRVIVKKTKKLFAKLLARLNPRRTLPGYAFAVGKKKHRLYAEKKENRFVLMIASGNGREADEVQREVAEEIPKAQKYGDDSKNLKETNAALQSGVDDAQAEVAKAELDSKRDSQQGPVKKGAAAMGKASGQVDRATEGLGTTPYLETDPEGRAFIRAREPRIEKIEGEVDTYYQRSKETRQVVEEVATGVTGANAKRAISNFYENDHQPEKSFGREIRDYVHGDLKKDIERERESEENMVRDGPKVDRKAAASEEILGGEIDHRPDLGEGAMIAITLFRPLHRQKTNETRRDHKKAIEEARRGSDPEEKIARLKTGIQEQLKSEVQHIESLYGSDPGASSKIRNKLRKGVRKLFSDNARIWGISSAKPRTKGIKRAGPGGTDGAVPMGGGIYGAPDFEEVEGQRYAYDDGRKLGVGNYIEFDHVVDAHVAEGARDVFEDRLRTAIRGSARRPEGEETAEQKARWEEIERGFPYAPSADIRGYERKRAGTIALYRPIHREVTKQMGAYTGDYLEGTAGLAAVADEVATYWTTGDRPGYDRVARAVRESVRSVVSQKVTEHGAAIRAEYRKDLKEIAKENATPKAEQVLEKITDRVGRTLRKLRTESESMIA